MGLASTGAVLGAGFSAAVMGIVGLGAGLAGGAAALAPLPAIAGVGAVLGAILTPLTVFSLLRRVALGKALLGTMLGMAIGTSVGFVASGGQWAVALAGGVGGFLATALVLRLLAGSGREKEGGE